MTIELDEPADLLKLVGAVLGTTDWMTITQPQVNLFAKAIGDHEWIYTDTARAVDGPFGGPIVHPYLTLSLTPLVISEVLHIRELTVALARGMSNVQFSAPVHVGSRIRATVQVMRAQQKTWGVESVFSVTYDEDGGASPVCMADVIVIYP